MGGKLALKVVAVIAGLALLFVLFEFVVPVLLPANF